MIILTKNKNSVSVTGDKGTLDYARRILKEKLTIVNNEYYFVEKRYYSTINILKSLRSDSSELKDRINFEKISLQNKNINLQQYNKNVSNLREEKRKIDDEIYKKQKSLEKIEKYLKYNKKEISFYKEGKDGSLDIFEIGFLRRVKKVLKEKNITFKIISTIKTPKIKIEKNKFNREYQYLAVEKILKKKNGIIKLPTGSGKTEIARQFINVILPYAKKHKKRILFVVEQSDLLLKTKDKDFTDLKTGKYRFDIQPTIGVVGAGFYDYKEEIIICTIQTLISLYKQDQKEFRDWAKTFCAYIVDECDMFTTDLRLKIIRCFENTYWRIFLSATPFSRFKEISKMKLIGISGGIIFKIKEKQLIEEGYLSKQEAVFLKNYCIENDRYIVGKNKWLRIYEQLIVKGKSRNELIFKTFEILKRFNNIRALFIVEQKEHGEILKQKLCVPFYSGSNDIYERKQAIENIQSGKEPIIITTRIFRRAVDIPELQVYFNCAGYKNDSVVLQAKGRIGRIKKENESKSLYIDIFDYGNKILEQHSEERTKTLKLQKIKVHNFYVKELEEFLINYFGKSN